MPLAASVVVLLYAIGVVISGQANVFEWLAAAAGVGFMVWFWVSEAARARRRARKNGNGHHIRED